MDKFADNLYLMDYRISIDNVLLPIWACCWKQESWKGLTKEIPIHPLQQSSQTTVKLQKTAQRTTETDQSNTQQKSQSRLSTSCVRSVYFSNKNCTSQLGYKIPSSRLFSIPLLDITCACNFCSQLNHSSLFPTSLLLFCRGENRAYMELDWLELLT